MDEVQDVLAVLAAPDPVLVLDRDDVDAVTDGAGSVTVVSALIATDPVMDLEWVGDAALGVQEGDDLASARRAGEIVGERGDAAAARRVGGDESGPDDIEVLSGERCRRGPADGMAAPAVNRGPARRRFPG
jgi:hypothetical protein